MDQALIDVVGDDETFKTVFHLPFGVDRIEASMTALQRAGVPMVPHIVCVIHYGGMRGEKNSVAIVHSNDQMLRNGDQFFPYRQNSDLFYLTGIEQEMTILLLCPDHPSKDRQVLLFIREPDLINRWKSGDLRKATCVSDNMCFNPAMKGDGIYCVTEERQKSK